MTPGRREAQIIFVEAAMRVSGFVLSAPLFMPRATAATAASRPAERISSNPHCALMAFSGRTAVMRSCHKGAERCSIQLATALAIPTAAAAIPPSPAAPAMPVQVAAASAPAPAASASGEEIIVQGMRVNKQQVREFIRAVTEAPYEGQLGRFHAPACPVAMGLPDIQNARVAARMRQVAQAAGIRVARSRASPIFS